MTCGASGAIWRRSCGETGGGATPRTPDVNNYVLLTYVDDPEPWSSQSVGTDGRDLTEGILDFWNAVREGDLNTTPAFVDPQTDRSRDSAQADAPALRVVDTSDEGITVRGVKAIGTGAAFGDWIHIGVFYRPGILPEQIIFGAVKPNTPGVTIICRESNVRDEEVVQHPLASQGDELDSVIVFEDVFIPWNQVFHIGNPNHASLYPQRVFDWLHYQALVRQMVRAELMLGWPCWSPSTSAPTSCHRSRPGSPGSPDSTRRSRHAVASEEEGFHTPGGLYKPNVLMFDFGRAYYLENVAEMAHEIVIWPVVPHSSSRPRDSGSGPNCGRGWRRCRPDRSAGRMTG
ncbi:FADH(2)-dependent monooxygenase TftD [Streptomyces tendae]